MLWNLIVVAALVLLALWVLGMALSWGGLIHILLVVALVLVVIRLLQGRKIAEPLQPSRESLHPRK